MTTDILAKVIFVISAAILVYTYAGYPILVYFVARLRPRPISRKEIWPNVTVLITAYNEEQAIAEKLANTLEIDYPSESLEILVASDGSTDRTDEIVGEFADRGVRLFRQEGRKGKTYTQNKAVEQAKGEVILFSDATTDYSPDVLHQVLPAFADKDVGCTAGRLIYVDPSGSDVGSGARKYWSYETFLKRNESSACSLIGASGCLYAVRRSAYKPMYPEACSDFLICTMLYEQGLRSVFVPEAVCFEETNRRASSELVMRIRVISQTFTDLWRNRHMMNPFKSGFYGVQLISHKLLRYAAPVFLVALLVTSIILAAGSQVFFALLLLQIGFYLAAMVAFVLERFNVSIGPLSVPLYLILTSYASIAGFYKFLRGERFASWEPIRKNE